MSYTNTNDIFVLKRMCSPMGSPASHFPSAQVAKLCHQTLLDSFSRCETHLAGLIVKRTDCKGWIVQEHQEGEMDYSTLGTTQVLTSITCWKMLKAESSKMLQAKLSCAVNTDSSEVIQPEEGAALPATMPKASGRKSRACHGHIISTSVGL